MTDRPSYTSEQIEFLRSHVPLMSYREVTKLFNAAYGLNKSHDTLRRACSTYGIKNGRQRKSHLPVGSEGVSGGYVTTKTDKVSPHGQSVWRFKHHLLWEAEYGPIPKGYCIIFADGNKYNFAINNLMKVSRRELVYLNNNSLRFSSAELTKTAVGIARLNMATVDRAAAMGSNKSDIAS